MNDTQVWFQLELEGIQAKGQSLSDGFQCCFLESPELKENPQPLKTACPLNGICLGSRKKLPSEFCSLDLPGFVFEVDTNLMH